MAKMYYNEDGNLELFKDKKVSGVGFGSQGHAHALNLRHSGVSVVVGLYKGRPSWEKAREYGLEVMEVGEAVKASDLVMMLLPDENRLMYIGIV